MARNRNRQAGPIRRTIVTPPTAQPAQPVSRNLLARTQTDIAPSLPIRRHKYTRPGGPDDWGRTSNLHPASTALTRAWDRTRSDGA